MAKIGRPVKYEDAEEPIIIQYQKAKTIGSYMVRFADGTRRIVEREEASDALAIYYSTKSSIEKDNFAKYLAKEPIRENRITLPGSTRIGGIKEWQASEFQDLEPLAEAMDEEILKQPRRPRDLTT